MKILVTGGAGYIGSTTVKMLTESSHEVVVFDNLVYGHKESVTVPLIQGDLADNKDKLEEVFDKNKFDAVIHFAGYAAAGESMKNPYKYFYYNTVGGLNLVETMVKHNVRHIVFSSSCTVYGQVEKLPVSEESPINIVNVYGQTKYDFEKILDWYDSIFGIRSVRLRYFNACGAALDGSMGEDHNPETHIIPNSIKAALKGESFGLFGDDYPTKDGTCIRDYIHILDLADAHLKALDYLSNGGKTDYFNIGVGKGYSNKEVLDMVKKVTGKDLEIRVLPRREGDANEIYADNTKAKQVLKWNPTNSDLETIVKSAYLWHSTHPQGYRP